MVKSSVESNEWAKCCDLYTKRSSPDSAKPNWWPAMTPYEVIVGVMLAQNVVWGNVEKSIANFGENLSPEIVFNTYLRPERDYRADRLLQPEGGVFENGDRVFRKYGFDVPSVRRRPNCYRQREWHETAASILLYAFGFSNFVVDVYFVRLCGRYPIELGKVYFEGNFEQSIEVYNDVDKCSGVPQVWTHGESKSR